MSESDRNEEFLAALVDAQRGLYIYVLRLLPNANDANDVLQEANLVMLRKQAEFQPGTDFLAWAATIAHYQVLSFRLKMHRERLVFDEELTNQLAVQGAQRTEDLTPTVEALNHCKDRLPVGDQELLGQRDDDGLAVAELAAALDRSPQAVSQSLYRIRMALLKCIQEYLASREDEHVHKPDE